MQLTKNFTLEELIHSDTAERKHIDNTPDETIQARLQKLANLLQKIRDKYGKSIIVNSGYRCPKLNKAVGGVSTSDHMYGRAADIRTTSNTTSSNKALFDLIRKMMDNKEIEVKQLIDEYGYRWVHVSYYEGGSKHNQVLHLK